MLYCRAAPGCPVGSLSAGIVEGVGRDCAAKGLGGRAGGLGSAGATAGGRSARLFSGSRHRHAVAHGDPRADCRPDAVDHEYGHAHFHAHPHAVTLAHGYCYAHR